MRRGKHGPNRLNKYEEIHETVLHKFRAQGFVLDDTLCFQDIGSGQILLSGTIDCLACLRIDVTKRLEILEGDGATAIVQNAEYSYSCVLGGVGSVMRFCNPHLDHNTAHHVHRFDVLNGDVRGELSFYEDDSWPTLGEVIGELRDWYFANQQAVDASGAWVAKPRLR